MSRTRLLLHGRVIPPPGAGKPVAAGTASFVDVNGNPVSSGFVIGQPYFIIPGAFTGIVDSYTFDVSVGGVTVQDGTFVNSGSEFVFFSDQHIGGTPVIAAYAVNDIFGTSVSPNTSTGLGTVVDRTMTKPTFNRTSLTTVMPMTGNIVLDANNTFPGDQLRLISAANQTDLDNEVSLINDNAVLVLLPGDEAGMSWANFLSRSLPTGTNLGATERAKLQLEAQTPNGFPRLSGYTPPFSPTDIVGDAVTDNFDAGFSSIWQAGVVLPADLAAVGQNGNTVAAAGGEFQVTANTAASGYVGKSTRSDHKVDIRNQRVMLKRKNAANASGELAGIFFGKDLFNGYKVHWQNGGVQLDGLLSGTGEGLGGSPGFVDPGTTTAAYICIRVDATAKNLIVEYAPSSAPNPPGSGDWTAGATFHYDGWPYWNGTDNVMFSVFGGCWLAHPSNGLIRLDNFHFTGTGL
jgi:hypothetical protein